MIKNDLIDNPFYEDVIKTSRKAKEEFMEKHPRYTEPDIVIIRECKNLPWALKMKANTVLTDLMISWIEEHCEGKFGIDLRKIENNEGISFLEAAIPLSSRHWFLRFELEKDAATFKICWC